MKSACWLIATVFVLAAGSARSEPLPEIGKIEVPREAPYTKKKDAFGQSHNLSGLFCPEADWCLAVADELHGFHRLKVARGADAMPIVSHDGTLDFGMPPEAFVASHGLTGDLKEFDLEAVAGTTDTAIFIGSHANTRNKGKVNPGSHLVAIVALPDLKIAATGTAQWASLDGLLGKGDMFPAALNKQLQCGGLNIEGATVVGADLLIGLRSPTRSQDSGGAAAYVISTPLAGLATEDFSQAKLHIIPTQAPFIGIRALETREGKVLAVTGDSGVNDLEPGAVAECAANLNKEDSNRPFQLRVWNYASGDMLEAAPVVNFDAVSEADFDGVQTSAKLEGLAVDPGRPGGLFIMYDSSATLRYLPAIP